MNLASSYAALAVPGPLARLVGELALGVVHLARDGSLLAANASASELLEGQGGAALATALGRLAARAAEVAPPVTEAVLPSGRGEVRVLLTSAEDGGYLAVLHRDAAARLRDQAIALRGMLAAAVECEHPEAALQRALEALARVIRDCRLAVWAADPSGAPAAVARARGPGSGPPDGAEDGAETLACRALATGLPVHAPLPARATPDGLQRQGEPAAALAIPVRDGEVVVGALVAVGPRLGEGELRLLTGLADAAGSLLGRARARAALEEAEARAERAKAVAVEREGLATLGHLAACVTHEIAGPLGCLGTNMRAALEAAQDLAGAEGAGEKVRTLAGELTAILRDAGIDIARALDLTRSLRNVYRRAEVERVRFDPLPAVEDAVRIFRGARRSEGEVRLEAPAALPDVEGSPGMFCQVVLNLLDNAFDACEGRGLLEVRIARRGPEVVLEVADQGPGIPPEIHGRVFEAYYTTKPHGRGTGLGLYICKDVVERMGGSIAFETSPRGTTFRVVLPAAA